MTEKMPDHSRASLGGVGSMLGVVTVLIVDDFQSF
jgi:hypothetical protein